MNYHTVEAIRDELEQASILEPLDTLIGKDSKQYPRHIEERWNQPWKFQGWIILYKEEIACQIDTLDHFIDREEKQGLKLRPSIILWIA